MCYACSNCELSLIAVQYFVKVNLSVNNINRPVYLNARLQFIYDVTFYMQCVKSEAKDKNIRYFIHYNGWNKK